MTNTQYSVDDLLRAIDNEGPDFAPGLTLGEILDLASQVSRPGDSLDDVMYWLRGAVNIIRVS